MLPNDKTCYATRENDVGKISTPFRVRLKPNAQLITQRPSKVPIHYRDKLNTLLNELEKYNIIKQIGSSPQDKPVYGTTYLNPLFIIPRGSTIKCVLDARHLNSNTKQSDESWHFEHLAPQLQNFLQNFLQITSFFTKQMSTFFKTLIKQDFCPCLH